MRLQTLILPSEGDTVKFALVLDQVWSGGQSAPPPWLPRLREDLADAAEDIGAAGVLIFAGTVDVV